MVCADAVWVSQQRDRQRAGPAVSPKPLTLYCGTAPWHFRCDCSSNTKFLLDWTFVNAKYRRNWELSYFYRVAACKCSLRKGKQNTAYKVFLPASKSSFGKLGGEEHCLFGEVCVKNILPPLILFLFFFLTEHSVFILLIATEQRVGFWYSWIFFQLEIAKPKIRNAGKK